MHLLRFKIQTLYFTEPNDEPAEPDDVAAAATTGADDAAAGRHDAPGCRRGHRGEPADDAGPRREPGDEPARTDASTCRSVQENSLW